MCVGDWIHHVHAMHEKYGSVVRVAPDELSFVDSDALRDIYGNRPGGELPKAIRLFRGTNKFPVSLLVTQDVQAHRELRRRLAPSFSDQAMRLQEPTMLRYVDLLLLRLKESRGIGNLEVDLRMWFSKLRLPVQDRGRY